jgi:pyruvate/2-oxoglutarate dehydrogenase complex dihydrolipoamide acyltransferase (E2) component
VYTDKLVAELPSPGKGKISKLNYKTEEACLVGKSLCEIEIEEDDKVESKNSLAAEVESGLGVDDILKAEAEKRTTLLSDQAHKSIIITY